MSCLLALRQFEFKLAFRYLVDSLKFSQSTWLVLFVFVFYKRTKGRIFDRRLNWCRGIYEGAI
jgi:hypothetical protein